MKLSWESYSINLRNTWRIAHGASDQRYNVFVCIGDGWGEAAGVPYMGEPQEKILAYLDNIGKQIWDVFKLEHVLNKLPVGSAAARTAIDVALHDALGKKLGLPVYQLLGLDPAQAPETSYSVGMDEPHLMAERAKASGMPIIKIKMGGPQDEAALKAIRNVISGPLRVDANAGWTREQAAELIPCLKQYDIQFVEQPLPIGDIEGLRWLKNLNLGVPIFADENIRTSRDVAAHGYQNPENRRAARSHTSYSHRACFRYENYARLHGREQFGSNCRGAHCCFGRLRRPGWSLADYQ